MDKNDLKSLEEALQRSPNNIGLRLNYALKLFKLSEFDDAEKNYQTVLKFSPENIKAKQGLIEVYFAKSNHSAVIVIAEELVNKNIASEKILELYAKSLLRQNNMQDAQEIYDKIIHRNPFYYDEELDSALDDKDEFMDMKEDDFGFNDEDDEEFGFKGGEEFGDFMMDNFLNMSEHMFLEERTIHLGDISGMQEAKMVLKHKLSYITSDDNLKSTYNLRNTGGVLMFGPYGCGKTHIIKSIPYEFDCKVLPFEMFRLNDPWSFHQDGLMHYFFNFARAHMPCVLFFDELDGLAFDRNLVTNHADRIAVSKFLTEFDSVRQNNDELIIVGATNCPWKIDPAMLRYGRFDSVLFIAPPSEKEREEFIKHKLNIIKSEVKNVNAIIEKTHLFSFAEIEQVFEQAIMKVMNTNGTNLLPSISQQDILASADDVMPSIKSWLKQFDENLPSYLQETVIHKKVTKYRQQYSI